MSNRLKSNRKVTEREPVYEPDDPERQAFIRENAVSLVAERDVRIGRLRAEATRLHNSRTAMKRALRHMQRERDEARTKAERLAGQLEQAEKVLQDAADLIIAIASGADEHTIYQIAGDWSEQRTKALIRAERRAALDKPGVPTEAGE